MKKARKWIALALLTLNVSGARAISVLDPCQASRDYFGPSLAFRGFVAKVMRQDFRSLPERSLGERTRRYAVQEVQNLQPAGGVAEIAVLPPISLKIAPENPAPAIADGWNLPTDRSPVQPPHLHSKK